MIDSGAPSVSSDPVVRVLYIMGSGHSGSTVMDTVLGNHAGAEGVGELARLPGRVWPNNEYCACHEHAHTCRFWQEVWRRWENRIGSDRAGEYAQLEDAVVNGDVHRSPKPRFGLHAPDVESPRFQRYAEATRELFRAISAVSGKPIVVDSSKLVNRAFVLSHIDGIDLTVIHLVRDVRGFVWSLRKRFTKDAKAGVEADIASRPVWRSAMRWLVVNRRADWVRSQLPRDRSVVVRYEDLIACPRDTLGRIGVVLGADLDDVGVKVESSAPLSVGHTIAGNRLRMSGSVTLALDEEWRRKMPATGRWLARGIGAPLMSRYGYRWR